MQIALIIAGVVVLLVAVVIAYKLGFNSRNKKDGEKLEKCKICGIQRRIPIGHGEHIWDYDDDSCWKVVWTWDEDNKTYLGKAYLYCKNDCGHYQEFECEIETEIKEPENPGEEQNSAT